MTLCMLPNKALSVLRGGLSSGCPRPVQTWPQTLAVFIARIEGSTWLTATLTKIRPKQAGSHQFYPGPLHPLVVQHSSYWADHSSASMTQPAPRSVWVMEADEFASHPFMVSICLDCVHLANLSSACSWQISCLMLSENKGPSVISAGAVL